MVDDTIVQIGRMVVWGSEELNPQSRHEKTVRSMLIQRLNIFHPSVLQVAFGESFLA